MSTKMNQTVTLSDNAINTLSAVGVNHEQLADDFAAATAGQMDAVRERVMGGVADENARAGLVEYIGALEANSNHAAVRLVDGGLMFFRTTQEARTWDAQI